MTGRLDMGGNRITGISDPISNQDVATEIYVDSLDQATAVRLVTKTLHLNGTTMPTATINWNNKLITSRTDPSLNQDAATKHYVDKLGVPKFVVTTGMFNISIYSNVYSPNQHNCY